MLIQKLVVQQIFMWKDPLFLGWEIFADTTTTNDSLSNENFGAGTF